MKISILVQKTTALTAAIALTSLTNVGRLHFSVMEAITFPKQFWITTPTLTPAFLSSLNTTPSKLTLKSGRGGGIKRTLAGLREMEQHLGDFE